MTDGDLPQFTEKQYLGDLGLRTVSDLVHDGLKWICRPEPTHDLGVDAHIEIVTDNREGTGRLLAVQIKCGDSYLDEREGDNIIHRGELQHLNYWLQHSLPVILVVCDPNTKECWWREITAGTVERTEKAWKTLIPRSQRLGPGSKAALKEIAGRPQHSDLAGLLLYRFLNERYGARIEICPVVDAPRDFYGTGELVKLDGHFLLTDYCYQDVGRFTKDRFDQTLANFDYNGTGYKRMLFLISQSRQTLEVSAELNDYFRSLPYLQTFRLLYTTKPLLELTDIDEGQDEFFAFLEARFDASAARSKSLTPSPLQTEHGTPPQT